MQLTLALTLLLASLAAWALEPLPDTALAQVQGGEKIIFNVSLRNNVDANLNPTCQTVGGLDTCRLALELAGQAGRWLVLNGDYGTLHVNDIQLDAVFLPSANSTYMDLSRFLTQSGDCLISGRTATNCNPAGKIALVANYPSHGSPDASGYPTDSSAPVYDDFSMFFHISQMAVVSDTNVSACAGGYGTVSACGFNQPAGSASFLGYHLSDASAKNAEAQMRFVGRAYVFGF